MQTSVASCIVCLVNCILLNSIIFIGLDSWELLEELVAQDFFFCPRLLRPSEKEPRDGREQGDQRDHLPRLHTHNIAPLPFTLNSFSACSSESQTGKGCIKDTEKTQSLLLPYNSDFLSSRKEAMLLFVKALDSGQAQHKERGSQDVTNNPQLPPKFPVQLKISKPQDSQTCCSRRPPWRVGSHRESLSTPSATLGLLFGTSLLGSLSLRYLQRTFYSSDSF